MTVGQWLDLWHRDYLGGVKQATVAHYGSHIETHLKPAIGAIRLTDLRPHRIQALYNQLLRSNENPDGLSAKSIKNLHGVLHRALKQAVMVGYLRSNPADACILPRAEKKEVREPLINHRYFITIDKSVHENSLFRALLGVELPVIRSRKA